MNFEMDSSKLFKIVAGAICFIILAIVVAILIPSKPGTQVYEVQSVILTQRSLSLNPGDSYPLTVIVSPSNATNKSVTYSSNNSYVASVNSNGYVTANNVGEARITVYTVNGKQDQCLVTVVEEKIPVTSITLDHDDITLTEGESISLNLTVEPSNTTDHNYTWTSSDPTVATVNNGKVTALKSGTTLITVMTENKKIAICDVEVIGKVTGITLDESSKTITINDKLTLNAKLLPAGSSAKITWTSSDPTVATVSGGVVNAVGVGTTTITAKAGNFSASAKINVKIVTTSDIYTFKYVKNQLDKPVIRCKTYSAEDRVVLEDKLARAVEKVGYGTRAGVVEAARFLVGGLDYRIEYMGTKSVAKDPSRDVGRYNKKGLNIGNSRGWGCQVSGFTQGMDCTNFVQWAFTNGGVKLGSAYSTNNTYPSTQVADKIKPGDLMLSPCYSSCRFEDKFSHVGIVIGVDDSNLYIAESTTGNINSIVISVYDKHNLPTKNKFSVAKLFNYPAEGKLTNMWD